MTKYDNIFVTQGVQHPSMFAVGRDVWAVSNVVNNEAFKLIVANMTWVSQGIFGDHKPYDLYIRYG